MVTEIASSCPYKGLRPYTEEDRKYFFGRERDKEVIASNLYVAPLTILYGTSGVGKSSVLQAGAIPQLREGKRVAVVYFNEWQGDYFDRALKSRTLEEVCRSTGSSPAEVLARIGESLEEEGGARRARPAGGADAVTLDDLLLGCAKGLGIRVLLVFDQFEEYFLYHTPGTSAEGFDAEFARAVNQQEAGVNFMLSMREEELSKLDRFRQRIPNLLSNLVRLENLDRDSAESAIVKPLGVYNKEHGERVGIEPGLVAEILRQVDPDAAGGEAGAHAQPAHAQNGGRQARIETPFLQLVLTRLWEEERAQGSKTLRLSTLERLGGAKEIASSHLDEVMNNLGSDERETAAAILRFLVTPTGSKIAQQPSSLASWAEVKPERVRKVLGDLSSKQEMCILRKVSLPNQEERYELFHDVLGPAIVAWRNRYVQEKRLARQREEADARIRSEQRRARRLQLFFVGAVLLLLMSGLSAFAFKQQREATRQKGEAEWQKGEAEKQKKEAERLKGEAETQAAIAVGARVDAEKANGELGEQKKKVEEALAVAKKQREEAVSAKDLAEQQKRRADDLRKSVEQAAQIDKIRNSALSAAKANNYDEAVRQYREIARLAPAQNRSARVEALLGVADSQINGSTAGLMLAFFTVVPEIQGIGDSDSSDEGAEGILMIVPYLLGASEQLQALENDDKKLAEDISKTVGEVSQTLDQASQANGDARAPEQFRAHGEIEVRRGDLEFLTSIIKSVSSKDSGDSDDESDGSDESKGEISPDDVERIIAHYDKASIAYRKAGDFAQEAKLLKKTGQLLELVELEGSTFFGDKASKTAGGGKGKEEIERSKRATVDRVRSYYDRAAHSYGLAGKPLSEASMYKKLGAFFKDLGDEYPDADDVTLSYYEEALKVYQKLDRPDKEGDTAETIGDLLTKAGGGGDDDESGARSAVDFYKQARQAYARAAARNKTDSQGFYDKEAKMLKAVADLLPASGRGGADEYFREVVGSYAKDFAGKARVLGMIAAYYKEHDKAKALDYYKQERDAWKSAGNLKEEGDVLYEIGQLSKGNGEPGYTAWFEEARKVYGQIDPQAKDADGDLIRLQALFKLRAIADEYSKDGKQDMAAAVYEDAINIYTSSGGSRGDVYTLRSLVASLVKIYIKGDAQKAVGPVQRALEFYRSKNDPAGEAGLLDSVAMTYKGEGKGQDAVSYYEQAISAYEKAKRFNEAAGSLAAIGKIKEEQGTKGNALTDYYESAAAGWRQQNSHFKEGVALWVAGNRYRELKQNQEALRVYEAARQACHDAGLINEEVMVLRSMGYVYTALGDKQNAAAVNKQADALANKEK